MVNKNKLIKFQILSVIFTWILGVILHFIFEWTGGNHFVGSFSAVNESVWEHLKLLFFPMLISTIVGYFYFGKNCDSNFLCAKTLGIIFSLIGITAFFYICSSIFGINLAFLNIGSFFVFSALGEFVAYKLCFSNLRCDKSFAVFVLGLLFVCFVVFPYFTPSFGFFKHPIDESFGIFKN